MRRVGGRVRTVVCAAAAGVVAMTIIAPGSDVGPLSSTSASAASSPVSFETLQGEGAWSIFQTLVPWENELGSAPAAIDLNYSARGSFFGRDDLITSMTTKHSADSPVVDYAISGTPFTAQQLAKVPGGNAAFISAPVQVASMAALIEPPLQGFQVQTTKCDPEALDGTDPSTWPPGITDPDTQCIVTVPYTGTLRLATRNVAGMLLHDPGTDFPQLYAWNNPSELAALGLESTDTVQQAIALTNPVLGPGPAVAGRSDPDEITYYLQQFIETAAPATWDAVKARPPLQKWEPISERLPQSPPGITRDGAEQQVEQLAQGGCGVNGDCSNSGGGIAAAPASMIISVKSAFPKQEIDTAQLQNANDDWVAPTPDSIDKAVDAGNETPLYALTNKIAGAYPLVWVDNLYAPAHGLSITKTESLAMLIRYLATTGQDKEAAVGEGRLSTPLVAKALSAADALVTSNCVGADRHIVSTPDPGPLTPPTATAMHSIGTMLHCVPTVAPTTTTTAAATTSTSTVPVTVATEAPISGPSGDTVPANVAPPATTATPTTSGPPTTVSRRAATTGNTAAPGPQTGLLTALRLPLPSPQGGAASDRIATFLLGAALYLFLRKPFARLAKRVAT